MGEIFKSAMGYFGGGGVGGNEKSNDFVGQNIQMGEQKLKVKSVIAEGIKDIYLKKYTITVFPYYKNLVQLTTCTLSSLLLL